MWYEGPQRPSETPKCSVLSQHDDKVQRLDTINEDLPDDDLCIDSDVDINDMPTESESEWESDFSSSEDSDSDDDLYVP